MVQDENKDINHSPTEDVLAEAKRLLTLTDIIDRYPQVVSRRVTGITYILISGGISFATLVMYGLAVSFAIEGWDPLYNLLFVGVSLGLTWFIAFRLIGPLTKSYPQPEAEEVAVWMMPMWAVIAVILAILSFVSFSLNIAWLFPVVVQVVMAVGNIGNYFATSSSSPSYPFRKENLYFAIVSLLSIPFMISLSELAYMLIIVIDIGGIYILGIYALITAERLLLESSGRG